MKNKILLCLLNSEDSLSMSQIAEKIKCPIQNVEYHLKQMVLNEEIICKEEEGKRTYDVYKIVRNTELYNGIFELMKIFVPEFYSNIDCKKRDKKEIVPILIKQVLANVLYDIER